MFRTAELGRKVSKEDYDAIAPALRIDLLELQQKLRAADFPTIIVFAGVDGAGKNQTVNLLNEWMDPRWIVTRAYSEPSDEERERPEYWRYWRDLPPKGRVGLFLRSWYSAPTLDAAYGRISSTGFDERLDRILSYETCLADDGAFILKFWLHLSRKAQKRQLAKLSDDPNESWRVTEADWKHWKMYDQFISAAERVITRTGTGSAPWMIIEGEDRRYRELAVLTAFRDAARRHLELRALQRQTHDQIRRAERGSEHNPEQDQVETSRRAALPIEAETPHPTTALHAPTNLQPSILASLDMSRALSKPEYDDAASRLTARLNTLYRKAKERGVSTVLVFEGWDAAGKGGTIRRITAAMDARDYAVIPIAAPTDEERAHHYLWRFWRHLSRAGRVTIFDRSWYGRVLVERVEKLATEPEWRRAYAEISNFEQQLIDHGVILVKYWMHITPEEQLARFERRANIPYKRWKLTEEDWRNRDHWAHYEAAVTDMIGRTSTRAAPWRLIEANDKNYARVKVLETLCYSLEDGLKRAKK
ncbi:Polyphosphate:AMP phosphotransferase [Azospirillaceae bacterium]